MASYSFCLTFGSKTFFERLKRERCRLVGATWFGLVQSPFLTHISHLPVQLIRYYSERKCTESSDHIFSCVSKKKFVPSENYNVLNSVWMTFLQLNCFTFSIFLFKFQIILGALLPPLQYFPLSYISLQTDIARRPRTLKKKITHLKKTVFCSWKTYVQEHTLYL